MAIFVCNCILYIVTGPKKAPLTAHHRRFPRQVQSASHDEMRLAVHNLSCARGSVQVLAEVNFALNAGEALVLRGPNGSGKTTLLRAIAGLAEPLAGQIEAEPESIAYSGHADGIKSQLSVEANLRFWAEVFGTRSIDKAVAAFDLAPLLTRRAGEMSAGQKRRLSLARLLVTGRPVWCLDEPTVSLDTENVARFANAVKTHLAEGGAALIATHIDLGLPNARSLDVTPFIAKKLADNDPFAGEGFL